MVYTKHMAKKSKKLFQKNVKKYLRQFKIIGPATALIILAVVALAIAWSSRDTEGTDPVQVYRNGETVTVEGTYVCLPHKDVSGPQTLECALGIKTDDDRYFGIQVLSDGYKQLSKLKTGDRFEVRGTFQKRESIYQSMGVIVTSSLKPVKE